MVDSKYKPDSNFVQSGWFSGRGGTAEALGGGDPLETAMEENSFCKSVQGTSPGEFTSVPSAGMIAKIFRKSAGGGVVGGGDVVDVMVAQETDPLVKAVNSWTEGRGDSEEFERCVSEVKFEEVDALEKGAAGEHDEWLNTFYATPLEADAIQCVIDYMTACRKLKKRKFTNAETDQYSSERNKLREKFRDKQEGLDVKLLEYRKKNVVQSDVRKAADDFGLDEMRDWISKSEPLRPDVEEAEALLDAFAGGVDLQKSMTPGDPPSSLPTTLGPADGDQAGLLRRPSGLQSLESAGVEATAGSHQFTVISDDITFDDGDEDFMRRAGGTALGGMLGSMTKGAQAVEASQRLRLLHKAASDSLDEDVLLGQSPSAHSGGVVLDDGLRKSLASVREDDVLWG